MTTDTAPDNGAREERAAEIAAGLAEIGTGGAPAFIRGYNAGYDDAYEHGLEPSEARREVEALNVERLRVAARRAGLPWEVSVGDIERLAAEYEKERLAQTLRDGDGATFVAAARSGQEPALGPRRQPGARPPLRATSEVAA